MKKVVCMLLLLSFAVSLCSCSLFCSHSWSDANCIAPKTCSLCGKTEGVVSPDAHNWVDATCQTPKTCPDCGATEGNALSTHTFESGECKYCGAIELTLFNYQNYLNCSAYASGNGSYISNFGYQSAKCEFEVTGNSHYKYKDVKIVVEFLAYDKKGYIQYLKNCIKPSEEPAEPYDTGKCYVYLNLAGNGSDTCLVSLNPLDCSSNSDISTRTLFNVVSVSGVIEEYK